MEKYDRLSYLTRHYYDLQGLRLAPLWVAGLLIAPVRSQLGVTGKIALAVGFLLVFLLWFWLISRYYRTHFGWSKPVLPLFARRTPPRWFHLLFLFALFALILVPAFVPFSVRPSMWVPFYFAYMVSNFLFDSEAPRARTICYGAGVTLLIVAGLLGLFRVGNPLMLFTAMCATMLALAITDHLLLLHLFGTAGEEADA